MFRGHLSDLMY